MRELGGEREGVRERERERNWFWEIDFVCLIVIGWNYRGNIGKRLGFLEFIKYKEWEKYLNVGCRLVRCI